MTHWTHPAHMVAGLVVWALWFVMMYGFLSVSCAVAPPLESMGRATWITGALLSMTGLTFSLLLAASVHCWRLRRSMTEASHQHRFSMSVAMTVYALSALATLVVGLPVLVWPPCV